MLDYFKWFENQKVKKNSCKPVSAGTILINVNGTAKKSPTCPNCGAWINHWHMLSDQQIPSDGDCPIKGCDGLTKKDGDKPQKKQVIEGCHVRIKDGGDIVYIAPLCHGCNMSADGTELELDRDITLVRANVHGSCGKLVDDGSLK